MDILKSKFSKLFIAAIFVFNINIATGINIITPQFVIEEDIMRVDTGNEQEISSVEYYQNNELISTQEGCQISVCTFTLHHLEVGTYDVIVRLENGNQLTTVIRIE